MCSLMYLEVFRSCKNFSTTRKRARKRLFSRVYSYVVDKLVFRLEGSSVTRAALPEAGVGSALGPADVLDSEVGDDLVHAREELVADLPRRRLLGVEPLAAHVAAGRRANIAQEGVRRVRMRHQRGGAALVVHVASPVPALLQRLLRKQLSAGGVLAQVAWLVRVQRVVLVVWRRRGWWRRGPAVSAAAATARLLPGHLDAVGGEVGMVGVEEGVHRGGGRSRRIAPFARHHPRGGCTPLYSV